MDLRVNGERLWQSLMTMAEIGATAKGGVNRQTLTDEDRRGRDLFRSWCEDAGLAVTSTGWAACSPGARAATRTGRRCCSAAISTASRPAASSTARSACSRRSRWCAR